MVSTCGAPFRVQLLGLKTLLYVKRVVLSFEHDKKRYGFEKNEKNVKIVVTVKIAVRSFWLKYNIYNIYF